MTHKLLAVVSVAVFALPVVSACAQDGAAATPAEGMETGPVAASRVQRNDCRSDSPPVIVGAAATAETASTVVENLLNLPPEFAPSTAAEHRPIHL